MKKKNLIAVCLAVLFLFAGSVHAALDYGNAQVDGYGTASHEQGIWQRLGAVNGVDDGVTWALQGSAESAFSNQNTILTIGETYTFRFNFWQGNNGIHTYDQLSAYFDFDMDRMWGDNEDGPVTPPGATTWTDADGEEILYEQISTLLPRHQTPGDLGDARYVQYDVDIEMESTLFSDGEFTWLRARATCNHTPYDRMTPYGYVAQGEVEDYRFTFTDGGVQATPEPATMLLFGMGLLGFSWFGRNKQRRK